MKTLFSYMVDGKMYYTPYQWLALLRDERTSD